MIKVGILSFAHMHAYSYAQALNTILGVKFVGIWDDDLERGRTAAEQFDTVLYSRPEDLFNEVDGVIVCSENSRHLELTLLAAEYKKHVLCEKPIATTLKDAHRMIEACRDAEVHLEIAFPCRFHPAAAKLRDAIRAGYFGEILAVRGTNHGKRPDGWFLEKDQAGGGAILDHTVHVVDLLRWFLGKEVTQVYAEAGTLLHDVDVEDCGLLSMEIGDRVIATLDTSWSRPAAFPTWGDVTLEIVGTQGTGYLDLFAQNIVVYEQTEITTRYENWGSDADNHLVKNFIQSIRGTEEPLASGWDGLKALEVALSAYSSLDKRQVVRI